MFLIRLSSLRLIFAALPIVCILHVHKAFSMAWLFVFSKFTVLYIIHGISAFYLYRFMYMHVVPSNEPCYEKTGFLHMQNKDADQLRGNHEADQRLCFRYIDSALPLFPIYQIPRL